MQSSQLAGAKPRVAAGNADEAMRSIFMDEDRGKPVQGCAVFPTAGDRPGCQGFGHVVWSEGKAGSAVTDLSPASLRS
jgi:hypothetical protein